MKATRELVEKCGGVAVAAAVLMELGFLPGRETVGDLPVTALTTIMADS
jgi:adenine phosphoribosyltransferase